LKDGQSWPKITKIPENIELFAMKDALNFCKKGNCTDICFSLIMMPGKKLKEVISNGHVLDKNPLRFRQILLQLTETPSAKSGLQQENENLKKWALKMASILPTHGTCAKTERGFCSSFHYGEKPLSIFPNSFYFSRNALRKKTCQKMLRKWFCLGRVVFRTPLRL
jgi:hypothetical protein